MNELKRKLPAYKQLPLYQDYDTKLKTTKLITS